MIFDYLLLGLIGLWLYKREMKERTIIEVNLSKQYPEMSLSERELYADQIRPTSYFSLFTKTVGYYLLFNFLFMIATMVTLLAIGIPAALFNPASTSEYIKQITSTF